MDGNDRGKYVKGECMGKGEGLGRMELKDG